MAEELEKLWSKLSFTEEEDEGINLGSNSTKAARDRGRFCVVLKILFHRCVNVEALRKTLNMLWKPSKSIKFSELEEDLFLVEFGDEREKRRVLDMSPWSYEKQLVLLQEFEGELTPKEIEMRWSPFWVQIYNLPLKCRTKETAWAIGSKLGSVMEVDVSDSGVQWGKYLRARVKIDVTKKLVRGKKITIEGGESRWVYFKYERLPNFCYRCGLLSHAIRDCPELVGVNYQTDDSQLQYGAWLRGEPSRRGGYEVLKPIVRGDPPNGKAASGGGTEQIVATAQIPEPQTEIGRAYVEKMTGRGNTPLTSGESKGGSDQAEDVLHENGKECESVEKKHEKLAKSSECASASSTNHGDQSAFMHWEKAPFPEIEPIFKFVVAPNEKVGSQVESPSDKDAAMGPMALSYNQNEGWVAAQLGPKSKHWKRLAREVNQNKPKGKKGLKSGKREGPTPLQELDPNNLDQKRRKGLKRNESLENGNTENEMESTDGGVAVLATQHRRAS